MRARRALRHPRLEGGGPGARARPSSARTCRDRDAREIVKNSAGPGRLALAKVCRGARRRVD
jgi:hypothetical protein